MDYTDLFSFMQSISGITSYDKNIKNWKNSSYAFTMKKISCFNKQMIKMSYYLLLCFKAFLNFLKLITTFILMFKIWKIVVIISNFKTKLNVRKHIFYQK